MSDSANKREELRLKSSLTNPEQPAGQGEEAIRRWRQPAEWAGRDNRPGFYSITGVFIELPDSSQASSPEQTQ